MAKTLDELLEVEVTAPKGASGLRSHAKKRILQARGLPNNLDATSSATVHRLEHDGIPDVFRDSNRGSGARHDAVAAWNHGDSEAQRGLDGVGLVAHTLHARLVRPDEVETVLGAEGCEGGVLGEKADTWMDRVALLALGDANDGVRVEIALVWRRSTEAD